MKLIPGKWCIKQDGTKRSTKGAYQCFREIQFLGKVPKREGSKHFHYIYRIVSDIKLLVNDGQGKIIPFKLSGQVETIAGSRCSAHFMLKWNTSKKRRITKAEFDSVEKLALKDPSRFPSLMKYAQP